MTTFDFTAIDFETMTAERTSACAIGIVRVENCTIVQKFYSLIKPVPDDREKNNSHVHGITPEMVEHAPTWEELWPTIRHFFEDQVIVCHNGDFDIDVMQRTSRYYGIKFSTANVFDTMMITHMSLADSCAMGGIPLDNHHDALGDATACAYIMLTCFGIPYHEHHYEKMNVGGRKKRELSSEVKKPLDASEVENQDTPFFQKRVVLTGILDCCPEREKLASILKGVGADINTSISGKTDIVIIGKGAGPSKLKKIDELNEKGSGIRIIYEPEFVEIAENFHLL